MNKIDIVKQIKDIMPFEFVTFDKICDKPRCENKLTGVKYPNEEPRLMNHHDERFEFGETRYYPVKLTMCSPCLLKENDKKADRRNYMGTMKMDRSKR